MQYFFLGKRSLVCYAEHNVKLDDQPRENSRQKKSTRQARPQQTDISLALGIRTRHFWFLSSLTFISKLLLRVGWWTDATDQFQQPSCENPPHLREIRGKEVLREVAMSPRAGIDPLQTTEVTKRLLNDSHRKQHSCASIINMGGDTFPTSRPAPSHQFGIPLALDFREYPPQGGCPGRMHYSPASARPLIYGLGID